MSNAEGMTTSLAPRRAEIEDNARGGAVAETSTSAYDVDGRKVHFLSLPETKMRGG